MRKQTAKWRRRTVAILAAALFFAIWVAVAPLIADYLVVEKPLEKADAIVILSGAADYAQRARGGAAAFHNGIAQTVLITNDNQRGGWDDKEKGNPYFVERMQRTLMEQGVPAESIEILPGNVYSTMDEADLVTRTAGERGYRGLLIVTSDFHSRRALWTFEQAVQKNNARLDVGLMPAPAGSRYPDRYTWWLTPRGWRSVAAEYVKFGWYWLYY